MYTEYVTQDVELAEWLGSLRRLVEQATPTEDGVMAPPFE